MMSSLRAASETWAGRIVSTLLMAFIVLSFAIFGIGDFLRGFGATKLATVGNTEISAESFRTAWNTLLQNQSARLKRNVTNEEARAAGLDRQLLNKLVSDAVIDLRGKQLGLAVADGAVTEQVTNDPGFKNAAGGFDRARFVEALRSANLTERGFLDEQRKLVLRQEQVEAVAGAMNPPLAMLEMLNRARNERRSIDYFLLPASAAGEISTPSDDELKKYFAARAQNFRAPEFRKIIFLAVRPQGLAKPESIAEEAALKRYDEVKAARFSTAEKRAVQQISFPTEAEANEAAARLKGGLTFEALAKERNLEEKDVDLGVVEKKALVGDIANVAFSLAENAVSEPVKNVFGVSLLRVTRIEPAAVKPFAEVAADIRRELSVGAAVKEVQVLHDKIEDLRTSGRPLLEAAKAAGLEAQQLDAVDSNGRDKTGAPVVADVADAAALLKAAFASGVGFDNDTITTRDRGYIWFEVLGIDPARANGLDEVKDQVLKAWREEETAKKLSVKATELVKQINGGTAIADVAEANGKLELGHVGDAQRSGPSVLPAPVIVQAFNIGVGSAGSALAPGGRMVFKVLDKAVAPLDGSSDDAKKLESQLRNSLTDEVFTQYIGQLQGQAKVTFNEAMLRQLTGGEGN